MSVLIADFYDLYTTNKKDNFKKDPPSRRLFARHDPEMDLQTRAVSVILEPRKHGRGDPNVDIDGGDNDKDSEDEGENDNDNNTDQPEPWAGDFQEEPAGDSPGPPSSTPTPPPALSRRDLIDNELPFELRRFGEADTQASAVQQVYQAVSAGDYQALLPAKGEHGVNFTGLLGLAAILSFLVVFLVAFHSARKPRRKYMFLDGDC